MKDFLRSFIEAKLLSWFKTHFQCKILLAKMLHPNDLCILCIYYYTETHQNVEITAPSFPAALTSVGSQLQRIRRQAFVSSRNWKRRGEEWEVFCKNTEYLETGLSFKKGTFLVRVSSQRGNIFQQVFLSKDNFSQKRNTSGQGVLFIRKNILRQCFRSKKECLEQGLFLSKRERAFFKRGYLGKASCP